MGSLHQTVNSSIKHRNQCHTTSWSSWWSYLLQQMVNIWFLFCFGRQTHFMDVSIRIVFLRTDHHSITNHEADFLDFIPNKGVLLKFIEKVTFVWIINLTFPCPCCRFSCKGKIVKCYPCQLGLDFQCNWQSFLSAQHALGSFVFVSDKVYLNFPTPLILGPFLDFRNSY